MRRDGAGCFGHGPWHRIRCRYSSRRATLWHHICIFGGTPSSRSSEDASARSRGRAQAIGLHAQRWLPTSFCGRHQLHFGPGIPSTVPAAIAALPMSSVTVNSSRLPKAIRWTSREYAGPAINGRHVWDYSIRNCVGNGPVWRSSAYAKLCHSGTQSVCDESRVR